MSDNTILRQEKIADKPQMTQHEMMERSAVDTHDRAELITRTLFKISNAVATTKDLDELYRSIHRILGEVMDLTNFYIALYDNTLGRASFPYFVDTFDSDEVYTDQINIENSLTGAVLKARQPVFLDEQTLAERARKNRVIGTVPKVWIGVPLKMRDEVIGIMAAQCYRSQHTYEQIDLDIMSSVSDQVALAIERKRNEQTIVASEKRYRNIIESIEDGYYEVDLSGRVLLVNQAICMMLGEDEQAILGANVSKYLNKSVLKNLAAVFDKVIRDEKPTDTLEFELFLPAGGIRYIETVISDIRSDQGEPLGFRGIARDVTQRKQQEQARKAFAQRLQQAQRLESLGTLAGGIAHDFNNLLMGIQGRIDLMRTNLSEKHPFFFQLNSIEEYVESAANLTARLLGFARGGKYEVRPVAINSVVSKSIRLFGRTRKEITLITRLADTLPPVEVDVNQLEQVLINLLVNAAQAMVDHGTTITVTTDLVLMNESSASFLELTPGEYVKVEVADSGIGMDKPTLEKIFDPFFTTKAKGHGTGLGLAMVYGILRNHGGAITADSAPGQGSVFSFYLPKSHKEVAREATEPSRMEAGCETILLVDDEQMIIEVGRELLSALGYQVLVAGSGQRAVEIYRTVGEQIDLVIIDMIMPQMGGGELFDTLLAMNPQVRVLLASGYSIDGQARQILERGCLGFIQKPFSLAQLSVKLREVLGG